jgi:hypothetical protein
MQELTLQVSRPVVTVYKIIRNYEFRLEGKCHIKICSRDCDLGIGFNEEEYHGKVFIYKQKSNEISATKEIYLAPE